MRWVSAQSGRLITTGEGDLAHRSPEGAATGLAALDAILPPGGFSRAAVHELLYPPEQVPPLCVAGLLGKLMVTRPTFASPFRPESQHHEPTTPNVEGMASAPQPVPGPLRLPVENVAAGHGAIVWLDPSGHLYPPAVAGLGIDLDRLLIVRPPDGRSQLWALVESLRCPAVEMVIATVERLSRAEARKIQLAAETGGGYALLLRCQDQHASVYSAATRWSVLPARGERTIQRWLLQFIHGHGRGVGASIYLENHRHKQAPAATPVDPQSAVDRRSFVA